MIGKNLQRLAVKIGSGLPIRNHGCTGARVLSMHGELAGSSIWGKPLEAFASSRAKVCVTQQALSVQPKILLRSEACKKFSDLP